MLSDVDIMLFNQQGWKTLVYFTASWCEPCKTFGPIIQKYAEKHPDFRFYKVSVEDNPRLAAAYEVMSLPTTILFTQGNCPKVLIGTATEDKLNNYFTGL